MMNFFNSKFLIAVLILSCSSQPSFAFVEWQITLQRLVSALKVSGTQDKTASEQKTNANKQIHESAISTIVAGLQNIQVAAIKQNYSFETGTGYNACTTSLHLKEERNTAKTVETVFEAFSKQEREWFQNASDGVERLGASLQLRRNLYCSMEEKAKNICKGEQSGSYGSGDSDASIWMLSRNFGGEELLVAMDYLDVIAPLPSINKNPDTAGDDIQAIANIRKAALLSGARANMMSFITGGMGGNKDAQ